MAIDNPQDKIREVVDESADDLLTGLVQTAGVFTPIFAVAGIAKALFDGADFKHRVSICLRALCDELDRIHDKLPADAEAALRSPWFKRAVETLILQAATETDEERAVMLARATAHGCFPNEENRHRQENLASYIRDLAQLNPDDIRMLKLLRDSFGKYVRPTPGTSESSGFRVGFDSYRRMSQSTMIDAEESLALCARLSGFGLAYEVPRLDTVQGPDEQLFRPTRRGMYLLSLLEAAETPRTDRN